MNHISARHTPTPRATTGKNPLVPDVSESDIIIVEKQSLVGDVVVHALQEAMPDFSIRAVDCFDAAHFYNAKVVIVSLMRYPPDIEHIEFALNEARIHAHGIPLIILTNSADEPIQEIVARYQPRGWLVASLGFPVMVAAVLTVLGGGTFLCSASAAEPAPAPTWKLPCAQSIKRPGHAEPPRLTEREREVLIRLKLGKPNKVIAHELNLSQSAIKVHLRNMMRKLRVYNRTQVVLAAFGPSGNH